MKPFFFCSVLLTDILRIVFKPLSSFQLLKLQNHDNILSLFCMSGEVFVDDCALVSEKLKELLLLLKTCSLLSKFIQLNKK